MSAGENPSIRPDSAGPQGAGVTATADGGGEQAASVSYSIAQRELAPGTSLVTVEGELDLASAPSLKWALTDAISAGARRIVVDLGPVTFIDSTALGVLVGVHRHLSPGTRMALAGANAEVLNIFEMTGLDATFEMFATVEHALAAVGGSEAASG